MVYFKDMEWWGVLLLFLVAVTPAFALTLTFGNAPANIDSTQEFEVDVSLACSSCNDSYLRGAFFSLGKTNYFGFTQNNTGSWIGISSDKTAYYHVTESSWSGKLKVKPDPEDSAYGGPGQYQFKVGRYTAGGSATWADPVAINIVGPTPVLSPTPTPTPTPTLTPTSPPSPKASKGHSTPTPKSSPISTPVLVATPSVLVQVAPSQSQDAGAAGRIVQAQVSPAALASPSPLVAGAATAKSNWWAMGVMLLGGSVFGLAVYLLIRGAGTMEK